MSITEQPAAQQGWTCPKCGTVWAPWQPCCTICGDNRTTFATGTTVGNPDVSWIPPHTQTVTGADEWRIYQRMQNMAAKPKHTTGRNGLEDGAKEIDND